MASKYLALDKIGRLFQIVKENGGVKSSFIKLFR